MSGPVDSKRCPICGGITIAHCKTNIRCNWWVCDHCDAYGDNKGRHYQNPPEKKGKLL